MNDLRKFLFILAMCMNTAASARADELKEALDPKIIDAVNAEFCYALKHVEDIKTCAQVKLFMAQALEHSTPSISIVNTSAAMILGSILGDGIFLCLKGSTGGSYEQMVIPAMIGALVAAIGGRGYSSHASARSARNFSQYFERLINNPVVIDRDHALGGQDEIYEQFNVEKRFMALCAERKLLEESPFFAQYRLTRSVQEEPVVSEITNLDELDRNLYS